MSKLPNSPVTEALTFKVPQKVGWSVQRDDQSWIGSEILGPVDCLAKEGNRPTTLSISLIFELPGNDGTVRS